MKRQVKKTVQKGLCMLLAGVAVLTASLSLTACVDQHPDSTEGQSQADSVRLVATSPAAAQICDKLELDLVGVCRTSGTLPERYKDVTQVGTAMSPDMEILKSLSPDYVLSPNSLQSDLQPKYAAIQVKSLFLNLKSVSGMYASIADLGEKFNRQQQAQAMVDEFNTFMQEYKNKNAGKEAPKVLILMGLPGSYIVATENSYVGSLVEMAGGQNVYAGTDEEFLSANTEDIKTKEPDVILRASHAMPEQVQQMFADEFEKQYVSQGFTTDRKIEETLDLGWRLLRILPKSELKRIREEYIAKYLDGKKD